MDNNDSFNTPFPRTLHEAEVFLDAEKKRQAEFRRAHPELNAAFAIVAEWDTDRADNDDFERLGKIIKTYAPLDAKNVMYLIGAVVSATRHSSGLDTFRLLQEDVSSSAAANASRKSEPWQRLAKKRYNELCKQGGRPPSFAQCARWWHSEKFEDEQGRPRQFPINQQYLARELSKLLKQGD